MNTQNDKAFIMAQIAEIEEILKLRLFYKTFDNRTQLKGWFQKKRILRR